MTRIGITGHMDLTDATVALVRAALADALKPHARPGLIGVSCIAAGADTIFAELVLDVGGDLEVVLPAADYRLRRVTAAHAEVFDDLVRRAARVRVMPFDESDRVAYEAANHAMLDSVELLMAVWDGQPQADHGGTAAVVASARSRGLVVEIVWPAGARRLSHPHR